MKKKERRIERGQNQKGVSSIPALEPREKKDTHAPWIKCIMMKVAPIPLSPHPVRSHRVSSQTLDAASALNSPAPVAEAVPTIDLSNHATIQTCAGTNAPPATPMKKLSTRRESGSDPRAKLGADE